MTVGLLSFGAPRPAVRNTLVNAGSSPVAFLNLFNGLTEGLTMAGYPAYYDSDQYPNNLPSNKVSSTQQRSLFTTDPNYYGRYLMWWGGTGCIQLSPCTIVYSGGAAVSGVQPSASGSVGFNFAVGVTTQPTQASPVEFSFGFLLGSASTDPGGLVKLTGTLTNALSNAGFAQFGIALPVVSAVWSGGTVTAQTNVPHGVPSGSQVQFNIQNMTPSGYNATSILATSTGTNTFTYAVAVDPGAVTRYGNACPVSARMVFNNVTGLPAGPEQGGAWTCWKVDNQNLVVSGSSSYAGGVSLTIVGGPGVQSEAIISVGGNLSPQLLSSGSYIGWNGAKFIEKGELANCLAGNLVRSSFVRSFPTRPRFIRFMDFMAVQSDRSSSWTYRPKPSNLSWNVTNLVPDYWGGVATNDGSDGYPCNLPTASAAGAWVEGEIVTVQVSGANTGRSPVLKVTGKPDAQIFTIYGSPLSMFFSGSVPPGGAAGEITMTITGGGLSGPTDYKYQPNPNATNTYTATIAAGVMTVTAISAGYPSVGQIVRISGSTVGQITAQLTGTANSTGTYQISNTGASFGSSTVTGVTPLFVQNGTSNPDTTFTAISTNIRADFMGLVSNGNGIVFWNKGFYATNADQNGALITFAYNPNINSSGAAALNTGVTFSASDAAGAATYTFGYVDVGYLVDGQYYAFTYSKVLGGLVTTPGGASSGAGVHGGPPIEFYAELCTRVGSGAYLCIGVMWSDTRIYNTIFALAQAGVSEVALELTNEIWNFSLAEARFPAYYGAALGMSTSGRQAWQALRTIQIMDIARQAWTDAGRNVSNIYAVLAYQFVGLSGFGTLLNGGPLNCSASGTNVTLKAYGGYGATAPAAVDYSTTPNRPAELVQAISPAPYWMGGQYNSGNGTGSIRTSVPLSSYNGALLAAYNYVYGNSTQKQAALDFLYDGVSSGNLYDGLLNGSIWSTGFTLAAWAIGFGGGSAAYYGVGTTCASYDSSRAGQGRPALGMIAYEGGWAMGPIGQNDINTQGNTDSGNLATMAAAVPVSMVGYTSGLPGAAAGPTSTANSDAYNLFVLLDAFRYDSRCTALVNRFFNEFKASVVTGGARTCVVPWFGFEGGTSSTANYWSLFEGPFTTSPPFKPHGALSDYAG